MKQKCKTVMMRRCVDLKAMSYVHPSLIYFPPRMLHTGIVVRVVNVIRPMSTNAWC